MKSNETSQGKLTSLTEIISPEKQSQPNKIESNYQQIHSSSTTRTEPQVTKITGKIVTSQPVTETHITRKIITTTKIGQTNLNQNNRYNTSSNSSSTPNLIQNKTIATSYTRSGVHSTSTLSNNNRYNNTSTSSNNNIKNNQAYRTNQKPVIKTQNNPQSRTQISQSVSGNRYQPKRPNVSSTHYKPRVNSPSPGSIKIKTIIRGKPIENILITHIINSSKPLDFHITEELNMDNMNTGPIRISEEERNKLQKSGKVEIKCSCDNVDIKKKPINLEGRITHYQHAQGIGMTDDKKENINPQFYSSEIKELKPLLYSKGEPNVEILQFRSNGKGYTTTTTIKKAVNTNVKPVNNYSSNNRGNNSNYNQNRSKTNTVQLKSNYGKNNVGGNSNIIRMSGTNYKGNTGSGSIVKDTNTKITMGSRSQFQNQSKPTVVTSSERKVYNLK